MSKERDRERAATDAVHAGMQPDPVTGAVMPPIHLATTFERDADGGYARGYVYSRQGNPNRDALETALAQLEAGAGAAAFPSGMAAAFAVLFALEPGDHLVVADDCYYGVGELLRGPLARWGLQADFVDLSSLEEARAAMRPNTALVWAESPSNPMLRISDLQALAELAHQHDARLAVDNTWPTPLGQQPLLLGADVVVHSTTKYLAGHSDVLGGAAVAREEGPLLERLREAQDLAGIVLGPFDCWLTRRGILSLPARLERQTRGAQAVAEALQLHPAVEQVHYPGLPSDPGHAVAARQMHGFGGMLSFQVRGGEAAAMAVAAHTRLFRRATSLGGPESLIEHRASIEGPHSATPGGLLRLSIGLEGVQDLIEDLDQALTQAQAG
ncbi:MAG: cystathionine gamma-synthase [Planctomycetes bacterium]|nr:cystathionine gamma-synthase [Planctomycetota bacterium]